MAISESRPLPSRHLRVAPSPPITQKFDVQFGVQKGGTPSNDVQFGKNGRKSAAATFNPRFPRETRLAIPPGFRPQAAGSRAGVAELVDAPVLGTDGASRGGSSPSARTNPP